MSQADLLSPLRRLDARALARWQIPDHGTAADKEARGHVLVIAGSDEVPGAALLAAVAALRAGAGKLTIAAPRSVALGLALAIPEARVIALEQAARGALRPSAAARLEPLSGRVDAVVIGPGMLDERRGTALVRDVLPMFIHSTVVLDAVAMSIVSDGGFSQPVILTPHAGEMAHLTGHLKEEVCEAPQLAVVSAAQRWNAYVALKGASTFVSTPMGEAWCFAGGSPGLATSGSGDTLAGLIGGLAARGMVPLASCCWGVALHARAGAALARRFGPLGYLARELAAEIPALITESAVAQRTRQRRRLRSAER